MRSIVFLLVSSLLSFTFKAQLSERFISNTTSTLTNWDPVRGEWLAQSIVAISKQSNIPDRMFPEEATPFEILNLVPINIREQLNQNLQSEVNRQSTEWNRVNLLFKHLDCSRTNGRSYGDPHLRSFDGATYSFQTVGEFLLARSIHGHLDVQTRQKAQGANFSLNSAVAMNVAGDRLTFYADDTPDNINRPFRLEGEAIQMQGRTYFLPKGGTIRLEGRNYIITWPTGERVFVDKNMTANNGFSNVTVDIFRCDQNEFEGLLGNNNQIAGDDFNGRNNQTLSASSSAARVFGGSEFNSLSEKMREEQLNFIAQEFADQWRLTQNTSLFEYAPGRDTEFYTNRNFPRVHYSVMDLPIAKRDAAEKRCRDRGVLESEMNGCIFDNGFLDIAPSPLPTPTEPFANLTLKPLRSRKLNNNNISWHDPHNQPLPIVTNNTNVNDSKPERELKPTEKPEKENIQNEKPERSPNEKPERENSSVEVPSKTPVSGGTIQVTKPAGSVKPSGVKPTPSVSPASKPVQTKPVQTKPMQTPSVKPGKG